MAFLVDAEGMDVVDGSFRVDSGGLEDAARAYAQDAAGWAALEQRARDLMSPGAVLNSVGDDDQGKRFAAVYEQTAEAVRNDMADLRVSADAAAEMTGRAASSFRQVDSDAARAARALHDTTTGAGPAAVTSGSPASTAAPSTPGNPAGPVTGTSGRRR